MGNTRVHRISTILQCYIGIVLLVSATPLRWDYSPVAVTWRREDVPDQHTDLDNWRDVSKLEEMLRDAGAANPVLGRFERDFDEQV